jgi:hypothetical protein
LQPIADGWECVRNVTVLPLPLLLANSRWMRTCQECYSSSYSCFSSSCSQYPMDENVSGMLLLFIFLFF